MNAQELYKTCIAKTKRQPRRIPQYQGLPTRVWYVLHRNGYGVGDDADTDLDKEKIYKDVLSGEIFYKRNVGVKTIKDICEWLERIGFIS